MYRQGDILLMATDVIPPQASKQPECVLALGEATGHKHEVVGEAFLWVDTDGTKYVEVYGDEAHLRHNEHGPILLSGPAIYRIFRQREYRPGKVFYVED